MLERIWTRLLQLTAEFVTLTGTKMGEAARYSVIVDRISHEVEYYRGYLKHAALQGTYVINNPFWWTADDKFLNYSVAAKLGLAIPKWAGVFYFGTVRCMIKKNCWKHSIRLRRIA